MAKVWGLWNGGYSYAVGGFEDIEVFSSLKEGRMALTPSSM
jgi:hypothetical protein